MRCNGISLPITLLVGALLGLSSAVASEAEWRVVSATVNSIVSVDIRSLRRQGALIKAWEKSSYYSMQRTDSGEEFLSAVSLGLYRCDSGESATKKLSLFAEADGKGEMTFSITVKDEELAWEEYPPDSSGAAIQKFVCDNAPK